MQPRDIRIPSIHSIPPRGLVSRRGRGRPKDRQIGILADLRGRIVNGTYAPGQRVPDRHTLAREFGASSVTIQKAFVELERCGFIESRGQRGTFVQLQPPHLVDFGIVFPSMPKSELGIWSRFWTGMINSAHLIQRDTVDSDRPRRFKFFEGIDGHSDSEDYQRLVRLIAQQRLAGVMFVTAPTILAHTPVVAAAGMPRVAIMGAPYVPGIPYVAPDTHALLVRAMEYFARRGRKRLSILTTSPSEDNLLVPLATAYGLQLESHRIQRVEARFPAWCVNATLAMFHREQTSRPDALLVEDDHLTETALEGLRKAGVRVPQDVEVVAMTNFPWSPAPMAPVTRIGWETRTIVEQCINNLDAQRRGEPFAIATLLPPMFENELDASRAG
jgi:hypothetical protein